MPQDTVDDALVGENGDDLLGAAAADHGINLKNLP
jgi:hypothetical protein